MNGSPNVDRGREAGLARLVPRNMWRQTDTNEKCLRFLVSQITLLGKPWGGPPSTDRVRKSSSTGLRFPTLTQGGRGVGVLDIRRWLRAFIHPWLGARKLQSCLAVLGMMSGTTSHRPRSRPTRLRIKWWSETLEGMREHRIQNSSRLIGSLARSLTPPSGITPSVSPDYGCDTAVEPEGASGSPCPKGLELHRQTGIPAFKGCHPTDNLTTCRMRARLPSAASTKASGAARRCGYDTSVSVGDIRGAAQAGRGSQRPGSLVLSDQASDLF